MPGVVSEGVGCSPKRSIDSISFAWILFVLGHQSVLVNVNVVGMARIVHHGPCQLGPSAMIEPVQARMGGSDSPLLLEAVR